MAKYQPKKTPGVYVFGAKVHPAWCYGHSERPGSSFAGLVIYHHPKRPRDQIPRDNLVSVTCPCGVTMDLDPAQIGTEDIRMPCADPDHYAFKYEESAR